MLDIQHGFLKRMSPPPQILEIPAHKLKPPKITESYIQGIEPANPVFILSETGQDLSSLEFKNKIEKYVSDLGQPVQFVIGPHDGLSKDVSNLGHEIIRFGKMTWPHLFFRLMLLEQIYRAQSIAYGHPYHRQS